MIIKIKHKICQDCYNGMCHDMGPDRGTLVPHRGGYWFLLNGALGRFQCLMNYIPFSYTEKVLEIC